MNDDKLNWFTYFVLIFLCWVSTLFLLYLCVIGTIPYLGAVLTCVILDIVMTILYFIFKNNV